ncbi:AAA family ATPase [Cryomorpha ignava]|uniref:AAA family ATPase n=1 Tax=Cryomorpha ignava TaxID=101383 RepID=A0A7K3WUL6_9FLAO|nr:ATP-binding protein [Cryomorpha ignava]NEN25350.1 AAA family ATPase [Cryomorpha ignava]
MASLQKIISFYKNCFEEENKGGGIANFLSAKVEKHTLIKGRDEHISGLLPYFPIDDKIARKLQGEVALYQKEKELIYGSHFLLGKYTGFQGKSEKLIAPLLIYPAKIIYESELFFIQADIFAPAFNPVILNLIKNYDSEFDETAFHKHLPEGSIELRDNGNLSRLIEKHLPGADASLMVDYPNNLSQYKITKTFQANTFESTYQLVPCSGFGMVRKSTKTRSTAAELESLSKDGTTYSGPIEVLFDESINQKLPHSKIYINSAADLNTAQENVIDTALKHKISLAIGPPGTGKSFTIANLAISMMNQGKSVLVCSRNDGAVNVIENKIEALLGTKQMCVRGGRGEIKELKNRLQFLLSRGHISESYRENRENSANDKSSHKKIKIEILRQELKSFITQFERADLEELSTGESILKTDSADSLWNRIHRFFLSKKIERRDLFLWNITELYLQQTDQLIEKNREYVNYLYSSRLHASIINNRELLRNYLSSLRASNTARQKWFLESINIQDLFRVFPIWLTTTKDVGEILPLHKEMFDIVVIDEASQCDISTCLPLLQRAKSAVIVGDSKQLRHISFLSRSKEHFLQEKHVFTEKQKENFTYREKSILDLGEERIKEQNQIHFLDEHYRSKPELIAFSNAQFYFDALKIMTNNLQDNAQALFQMHSNGKRDKNGINQKEIDLILSEIKDIIEIDKHTITGQKQTIGILSPFRNQVDQIATAIQENLEFSEIQNHSILVGTAHSFQGEERDVMFISFALDDDSQQSAFHFLNKDDVFNVSITRAKNKQYLVSSFDKNKIPIGSLLRKYYDSKSTSETKGTETDFIKDKFTDEVCAYIESLNHQTRLAYSIAGVTIDIVIEHDKKLYGIDMVGFPGPFENTIDLYKYKALMRAGIKMIPISYALWRYRRQVCEEKICAFLNAARVDSTGKVE